MFLHGRSEDRDGTKRAVDGDNASYADLVYVTRETHVGLYIPSYTERRWFTDDRRSTEHLKPNSITLAGSELAPNRFGAGSELVRS